MYSCQEFAELLFDFLLIYSIHMLSFSLEQLWTFYFCVVIEAMTQDARANRDLYLMYMLLTNPSYALYSRRELYQSVNTTQRLIRLPPDERSSRPYECCTQEHDGLASIYLGIERGRLHLWENGSVINWTCRKDGWPVRSENGGLQVLIAAWYAKQAWNKVLEGRVKFKYVSKLCDAAFEVRYKRGGRKRILESSFFPTEHKRDLNFVKVYHASFDKRTHRRYPLYNTMLHELGHILGLRHEFAHTKQNEMKAESILFGTTNPKSAMAYYPSQDIQPSDEQYVRKAYDELGHGTVVSALGPYGSISKKVVRVRPNN